MKIMTKLERIAAAKLNGIISEYKNEVRPWMEEVNEDDIYKAISEPDFGSFVEGIFEDATGRRRQEAI